MSDIKSQRLLDRYKRDFKNLASRLIDAVRFIPPEYVTCPNCGNTVQIRRLDDHWDHEVPIDSNDYNAIWSQGAKQLEEGWETRGSVICPVCKAEHKVVYRHISTYINSNFSCPKCKRSIDNSSTLVDWDKVNGSLYTYRFSAKIVCSYCNRQSHRSKTVPDIQKVQSVFIEETGVRTRRTPYIYEDSSSAEKELEHLSKLKDKYTRTLYELQLQEADYAGDTPAHIRNGISDFEQRIQDTERRIAELRKIVDE